MFAVNSHQFLSRSLKIKLVLPLMASSLPSSVMPTALPLVENSRCACSTAAVESICKVNRFTGARYWRGVRFKNTQDQGGAGGVLFLGVVESAQRLRA